MSAPNPTLQADVLQAHPIPIGNLSPGLYWITQPAREKGVIHHAILDVGCCVQWPARQVMDRATMFHQTPPSIRHEPIADTGFWSVHLRIGDEAAAIQRLAQACINPRYHVIGNNCEHFARYIATGVRESKQLQAFGVLGMLVGFVWALG